MKKIIYLILLIAGATQAQTTEKSLFWEISGNGLTEKSYLYGTMHVQDQRVFNFDKKVTETLLNCDAYVMELNLDSVNQAELMQQMLMKDDASLKTLLSKKKYKLVEQYFKDSLGMNIYMYQKMNPIITSQMVSLKDMSQEQEDALDIYFNKLAKENGIQTMGLEKMEDQIKALCSIPYKAQAEMLYEAVKDAYANNQDAESEMDKMLESYIAGDLEALIEMADNFSKKDKKAQEAFTKTMLNDRNITMANGIEKITKTKTAFIAVGAAHLGGENGVIQLLRDKGFTVVAQKD